MRLDWDKIKALLTFLLPSMAIGAVVGSYPGYKVYEFTWKEAAFCTSCHVHDYASVGWKNSIHGRLTTCHDCHHQPLHAYMEELYILVTKHPKFPKDLHAIPHVPKDLCQACHVTHPEDSSTITGPLSAESVAQLPKVDRMKLHRFHLNQKVRMPLPNDLKMEGEDNFGRVEDETPAQTNSSLPKRSIQCMDCHGGPPNRAQNFSATDRACTHCHENMRNHPMGKQMGCRNCHFQEFMTPVPPGEPDEPKKSEEKESEK